MTATLSRVLLTNDDGIDADGLAHLGEIAAEVAHEVWIVAPEVDQSGSSHSVTLHDPVRCRRLGARHYAVSGTPSDCVLMATQHLMRDALPEMVLSGINRGANVSDSVAYSGTLGGAMTALVMGVPAIALSQAFHSPEPVPWETARRFAPALIRDLAATPWRKDLCFSVNFPAVEPNAVAGRAVCRQGRGSIAGVRIEARTDTRDKPYYWFAFHHDYSAIRAPDTDVEALRRHYIAISPLRLERHDESLEAQLAEHLGAERPR
ncbi:5'/3'-nucleotidase SurE [Aquisalimonas sp.]|uniref:5'/3'-nucleotidase SurE n=1 Tax=Aquisalimonas sp. TaxID=1872621 RepID=UPI0025C2EDBA|nr:5'/3'-nucleotidase SurE [Aquisalimonas sp.]